MWPPDSRRECAWFGLAAIAFGMSYAVLPLYSSNQNHHFLIGIARAGDGLLRNDWLVSTRDPFPVFTAFVWFVHKYLADSLHYLVYILLLGAYAYGLMRIGEDVFPSHGSADARASERLLFLAIICVLHNEVIGYLLGFGLRGMPWWQMTHWGVAEQELFGHSAFQASSVGLLLPLAIHWFLQRRSRLAALTVAAVLVVHFSYAITAAALVVGFMFIEWRRTRSLRTPAVVGAIALAIALPPALYVLLNFGPTSADASARAAAILVAHLPQETQPSVWFGAKAALQIVLMIAGIALAAGSDLFAPLLAVFVAGASLTAAQLVTGSPQLALLFPWRVSVLLVPIATALIVRVAVRDRVGWPSPVAVRIATLLLVVSVVASSVRMILNFAYYDDVKPLTSRLDRVIPGPLRGDFARAMQPETLPMMDFVRSTLAAGDLYVIPPELQRFRLRSGAPVLADSKSHPYKDVEVLEWNARLDLVRRFYASADCATVAEMHRRYAVTHVVFDDRVRGSRCAGLERVYSDPVFDVYRVTSP